jgi:hypothetical protein
MATATVMESCFTPAYLDKAEQVFLRPGNRYPWDNIVNGAQVLTSDGSTRLVSAVDPNTFRGYHKVKKNCPGAQKEFRDYLINHKSALIEALVGIQNREQLHQLENEICRMIRGLLKNVKPEMLNSYNKVRKPVDLYIMNLVAMAVELDAHRAGLVPLLFVPLDSQIMKHAELFEDIQLKEHHLSRRSTYKDVKTETAYRALQNLLSDRAATVEERLGLGRRFFPIYLDLIWNNKFSNWGSNLFEVVPPTRRGRTKRCN